ncbi:hypothetical protein PIB30_099362 [Stylosanthes scabra]|uniref:Secreted protein n=1 Tax=Stylosanthes scabra TaxID=79078 RepID=A0ABU6RXS0_9FABA|nr:hypothetical protein [Stylosanthes scabra]
MRRLPRICVGLVRFWAELSSFHAYVWTSTPMHGPGMLGLCFIGFHTYTWCSTPHTWNLSCLEGASMMSTHMLDVLRLCVGSGVGGRVKATPRLPGARLGMRLNVSST